MESRLTFLLALFVSLSLVDGNLINCMMWNSARSQPKNVSWANNLQQQTNTSQLFKSTIQPTSPLHNLLPLLGNIPLNLLVSAPKPKKYQSFFSHALSHSDFTIIVSLYLLCVLSVCVSEFLLVGWLSGRTSVSDRRTFTGLHRTCS